MRLTDGQIEAFETEGYIALPDLFPAAEQGGMVAPTGEAGTVLLFDCNLVHASPGNISPWNRTMVHISACHVDNHIRRFQRPEWIAHRDFTPIDCLPDDCLRAPAPEPA